VGAKNTGGKGNRKLGNNADYCKLYKSVGLQEKNQKRRMRRHILRNPDDIQAAKDYAAHAYGEPTELRVSVGGKLSSRPMTGKAKKHQNRKNDTVLHGKLKFARDGRRHARMLSRLKEKPEAPQPAAP
jgi:hypothetical protein